MVYYEYIFYRTYKYFFRMSAYDMPGVKAILLTGFVIVLNVVLMSYAFLKMLGHNMNQLVSPAALKFSIVAALLSLWLINYSLFWHDERLATVLEKFEDQTVSYNQSTASILTAAFFILPVILFVIMAIQGANVRN